MKDIFCTYGLRRLFAATRYQFAANRCQFSVHRFVCSTFQPSFLTPLFKLFYCQSLLSALVTDHQKNWISLSNLKTLLKNDWPNNAESFEVSKNI